MTDTSEEKKYPHRFEPGNDYRIVTTERAKELVAMRRAHKARSRLRGLADAAKDHGADLPDVDSMTDEEAIAAASDAVRMITRHMANTFLDSKNVRGQSDSYNKLIESLAEDPRDRMPDPLPPGEISMNVSTLVELASQLEAELKRRQEAAHALDGELTGD